MMKNLLRSLLPLLLLGSLASCSVYEGIVHPHRLPTPDLMSKAAKAKFRASEKARHKGQVLKSEEPVTSATDPAPASTEAKKDTKVSYSELPEGTKAKYDRDGLLKGKPNLKRLQYHRYDTRPLTPNDVNRENRRLRKHPKGKGKSEQDAPPPKVREEAPAADSPAEPKPEKVKEPKEKKSKKAPLPKPDPTVEQGGN